MAFVRVTAQTSTNRPGASAWGYEGRTVDELVAHVVGIDVTLARRRSLASAGAQAYDEPVKGVRVRSAPKSQDGGSGLTQMLMS